MDVVHSPSASAVDSPSVVDAVSSADALAVKEPGHPGVQVSSPAPAPPAQPAPHRVCESDCSAPPLDFGASAAVLHEIRHALTRLIETGEPTCIDLAALPFGPGDQQRLLAALGHGEVAATVDALGQTQIQETRYSGVWLVDYRDGEDERIGLQVEIAPVPRLLQAQPESLPDALAALTGTLAATSASHPSFNPIPIRE